MDRTDKNLIPTQDGSLTLRLDEYDENMHSLSGAYEEALLKHVAPSGILEKSGRARAVLDVGFGLGYNVLALAVEYLHGGGADRLSVVSLEKDRSLLPALSSISFQDHRDEIYALMCEAYKKGSARRAPIDLAVIFGDARDSTRALPDSTFDAVFFDPFSPSKNPELWSVDYARQIYRVMKDDAILTTYSSAPQIRMALSLAGFMIGKGPAVGGKREGTLAAKSGAIIPLERDNLESLYGDPRSVPYRDPYLSDEKISIIERRKKEIAEFRSRKKEGAL